MVQHGYFEYSPKTKINLCNLPYRRFSVVFCGYKIASTAVALLQGTMNSASTHVQVDRILQNQKIFYFTPVVQDRKLLRWFQVKCSLAEASSALTTWLHPDQEVRPSLKREPYVKYSRKKGENCVLTLRVSERDCRRLLGASGLHLQYSPGGPQDTTTNGNFSKPCEFCCSKKENSSPYAASGARSFPDLDGAVSDLEEQLLLFQKKVNELCGSCKSKKIPLSDFTSTVNNAARAISDKVGVYDERYVSSIDSKAELNSALVPFISLARQRPSLFQDPTTQASHFDHTLEPSLQFHEAPTESYEKELKDSQELKSKWSIENKRNSSLFQAALPPRMVDSSDYSAKAAQERYDQSHSATSGTNSLFGTVRAGPDASVFDYNSSKAPLIVTETIKLEKREIREVIGPNAEKVDRISQQTGCRIVLALLTNDRIWARGRGREYLHSVRLSGAPNHVARAKTLLRRALLEVRSQS